MFYNGLFIDPGKWWCGWAVAQTEFFGSLPGVGERRLFSWEKARLVQANLVGEPSKTKAVELNPFGVQENMVSALEEVMRCFSVEAVFVERQQVYKGPLQKGDPNDLIDLAEVVGMIRRAACEQGVPCVGMLPAEWKHQMKKPMHHARVLAAMQNWEKDKIIKQANKARDLDVMDAVCMAKGRYVQVEGY